MLDIRATAVRWARTWTETWEALEVEPIVALDAPDVTLSTEPFREASRGHDGVRQCVTHRSPAPTRSSTPELSQQPGVIGR